MKKVLAFLVASLVLLPATEVPAFGQEQPVGGLQLPPGFRAVGLRLPKDNPVPVDFLGPGSRVDLVATRKQGNEFVSTVLVKDVLLLAVDSRVADQNQPKTVVVTVALTAKDAQRVALAQKAGTISVLLRPLSDTGSK